MSITPSKKPLVVTTGEPAGIGMDIVLQLAVQGKLQALEHPVIVLADETVLKQRAQAIYGEQIFEQYPNLWQRIDSEQDISEQLATHESDNAAPRFYMIDVPCAAQVTAGQLNVQNAQMVINQLKLAHQLAISGSAAAIVTGPLQKSVLIDAGITLADGSMFTGHTEFFMQQSGCDKVVMMLANAAMKVALVTTHLPLSQVAAAITTENLQKTIQILMADLKQKFGLSQPKVLVCGLNPHAGEDGHLGTEEIDIINPVLREFQQQGMDLSLAMPADTLFTPRHLQQCDAVLAMYHDQGLPVLKSHGFGDTVNLTLGLPYIRTSVDHGTALDLAGHPVKPEANQNGQVDDIKQVANSHSLWQALTMASDMANATVPDLR
ncbi:4-hydroxythreonine-4-phosphate dehydrogenase PdxA [Psychrobacter sp. FDAARGOS_221]|uniref:4-hydroxythreonine-4-phosphate dehydrogenase PdxA n=1 Tax=Psychrobacter sp. FDAARGOS_221 TaxID=1975705 RepID=UPI000BB53DAD|nr:4-hydroxythreonine-4-phosphate dehydrogenase PdxA [Psychrobacter sp. FDAARGOS_221]PNK61957.1 4-hydroxythreonine-4-phosphate dehydrogenase PdxA [Psychrobacter sp. FDAARGOS_221]